MSLKGERAHTAEVSNRHDPVKASRIVKERFSDFSMGHISRMLTGQDPKDFTGLTVTDEQYNAINALSGRVGFYLVEAARHSPLLGGDGSYAHAEKKIQFGVHEVLHAVVAWYRRGSPIPAFMTAQSPLDKDVLTEEVYALLGFYRSSALLLQSTFETFEQARDAFLDAAYRAIFNTLQQDYPDYVSGKRSTEKLDEVWKEITNPIEPQLERLMRNVYESAQRTPPKRDTVVEWMLEQGKDIPEFEYLSQ